MTNVNNRAGPSTWSPTLAYSRTAPAPRIDDDARTTRAREPRELRAPRDTDAFERTLRPSLRAVLGDAAPTSSKAATSAAVAARATDATHATDVTHATHATHATDDVVERVFQDLLGRSAGQGGFWHEFAAQKQSEGMSLEHIANEVRMHVKASDEYQALHATDIIVDEAFRDLVQRESGGAGFWHEFAKQKQSEGMSLDDIDREVRMHLQASDEYQALHPAPEPQLEPQPHGNLGGRAEDAFVHQPNGWTCGPTSLTMALAHHGLGAATQQRAAQIASETGTTSAQGFPGGVALMASEARERGLQATHSSSRDVGAMRAALESGRSLIVNGTDVGSGVPHFIYVAGLADDGALIVNDPIRGGTERWTPAQLHAFTHGNANPPGFVAVWT